MDNMEDFTLALGLAITAPTQALCDECSAVADSIAATMSDKQIDQCKAIALEGLGMFDKEQFIQTALH